MDSVLVFETIDAGSTPARGTIKTFVMNVCKCRDGKEGVMPREVIHQDGIEIGGSNSTPYSVEVGWARGTHVQIATTDMTKEVFQPERGWWVDLDRAMINKLIKVLRRARDQAFGADE